MKITELKKFFVWPYMNELAFKTIFLMVAHMDAVLWEIDIEDDIHNNCWCKISSNFESLELKAWAMAF